jgi:predicted PurR-regulated permease PerM
MIAAVSWAGMAWPGLPQPFFRAFLIFVASYMQIDGGVVAIFDPALFSVMMFEGFGKPLILLSALLVIGFAAGNIIQPRMQGAGLNLDAVDGGGDGDPGGVQEHALAGRAAAE